MIPADAAAASHMLNPPRHARGPCLVHKFCSPLHDRSRGVRAGRHPLVPPSLFLLDQHMSVSYITFPSAWPSLVSNVASNGALSLTPLRKISPPSNGSSRKETFPNNHCKSRCLHFISLLLTTPSCDFVSLSLCLYISQTTVMTCRNDDRLHEEFSPAFLGSQFPAGPYHSPRVFEFSLNGPS